MSQYVTKIRTEQGDLQIDYNALANKPELNTMFSNPNFLINSDFRNPVNQRGQTTYTEGTERYGIDRWFLYNSTREVVNSGSITVTNVGASTTWFVQKFDRCLDNNLSYVITVNVGKIVGSGINVYIGNQDEATTRNVLTTGLNTFIVQPNEITSAMEQLAIALPVGSSIELFYIKLECGTIATPFIPRPVDEEILLCYRYYQVSKFYKTIWSDMFGEQFIESVPFGTPMRKIPTLAYTIDDQYNVSDVSCANSDEPYTYRVAYKLTNTYGNGHRISAIVAADAEIY